jgi:hypothetical protein
VAERLAFVAVCISGAALFLALISSAPETAGRDSLRDVERVVLKVSSEENALFEERALLKRAFENIDEMRQRFSKTPENAPDPNAFAAKATDREMRHRRRELVERLKVLNLHRARRVGSGAKGRD